MFAIFETCGYSFEKVPVPTHKIQPFVNPFMPSVPEEGHWQTVQTQIRRCISVYTVCIQYGIFIINDHTKNKADTPEVGNGHV